MSNTILIGFMGSGKSSVGRRLSYRQKKTFIDTDAFIEKEEKRKIATIFEMDGEAYFRLLEPIFLKNLLLDNEEHIIAVGGGLPITPGNPELLKQLGKIIYLKVQPETIIKRLHKDTKRPLLQGDNPIEKIVTLMKKREPIYEKLADKVVEVDNKKFSEIIREIQNEDISN